MSVSPLLGSFNSLHSLHFGNSFFINPFEHPICFPDKTLMLFKVPINIIIYYLLYTMLCQFLLYNKVNQLYVHIYPLPLKLPSYSSLIPPRRTWQSTELSSLCYITASYQLSVLHMVVYLCQSQSPNSSHLPLPHQVHMSAVYVCVSIPALQINSSVPFFLN